MYEYSATCLANVDGDTINCRISLGLDIYHDHVLRLAGINCPELPTPAGKAAAAYTASLVPPGTMLTVETVKEARPTDKYGRYLAYLILRDGRCVNRLLVDGGFAAPYGPWPVDP